MWTHLRWLKRTSISFEMILVGFNDVHVGYEQDTVMITSYLLTVRNSGLIFFYSAALGL